MIEVKTRKNSLGYFDCYIELGEINDLPGVRGSISDDFLNEIVAVFENNYGVSVGSYPMSTRIELLNIVDDEIEIAKGKRILQVIAGLINSNLSRPTTRSDELVKESQDMQYLRSIGAYCKSGRSSIEQEKVNISFSTLKAKGATPWEMDVNFFLVRDLKRGFFKENHERILGIDELLLFSQRYQPK